MAVLRIPDEKRTLRREGKIREHLAGIAVEYERWPIASGVAEDAPAEQVLQAYAPQLDQLKQRGGYVTADVIDVNPNTPGLDTMLAKFNIEHRHDEDEVRYIVAGRG